MKPYLVFLALLTFVVLGFAAPAYDNWMPVTAQYRSNDYEVSPNGELTLLVEKRGAYLRSSSGSDLRTLQTIQEGRLVGFRTGTLRDVDSGQIYRVLYGLKQAVRNGTLPKPLTQATQIPNLRLGTDSVAGIECTEFRMHAPEDGQTTGSVCLNEPFHLILRMRIDRTRNGKHYRLVNELVDVQLGVEPDASALRVPEGFLVTDKPPVVMGVASASPPLSDN